MKLVSTALLAAGMMALSACGGGEENVAANNVAEDYNLTEDLGSENLLGNEVDANAVDLNAVDANAADANASAGNETNSQ
jgi:predicted lipoprotein